MMRSCAVSSDFIRFRNTVPCVCSLKPLVISCMSRMSKQTLRLGTLLRMTVYYAVTKSLFPGARSLGGRLGWRTRLFQPADSLDLLSARWCELTSYICSYCPQICKATFLLFVFLSIKTSRYHSQLVPWTTIVTFSLILVPLKFVLNTDNYWMKEFSVNFNGRL